MIEPYRGRMRACRVLENEPAYARIDASLDVAYQNLERERRIANATRDQATCNSERDSSPLCRAQRYVTRLEHQVETIGKKHGVEK